MAYQIRKDIVLMIGGDGHVGHLGGSCSSAEIVSVLYFHKMKIDPKNPKWEGRDKFLYSKGHSCIAQYAALGELGFFNRNIKSASRSIRDVKKRGKNSINIKYITSLINVYGKSLRSWFSYYH